MKQAWHVRQVWGALWFVAGVMVATTLTAAAGSMTVATGQAQVKGSTQTVLTDAQGMTLYYSTQDGTQQAKCTGQCAQYWPPLVLKSGDPSGPASVADHLSVFDGANGRQVAYNGHPLYTFARDQKAGQANGEGVAHHWHVATPDMKPAGSTGASSGKSSW